MHNSRRPCSAISLSGITVQGDGCLVAIFCTFWRRDLDIWLFDLILICGWDIVIDYPRAKFGDFSFSRFGFIVRTDRHTESQIRMIIILTNRLRE